MAQNSKSKGSQFERDVCRKLSLWVTNGKRKDCFWRAAMSGGRATVARKRGESVRQSGDITAVALEGRVLDDFYIECKFYKDLALESFFLHGKGKLAEFWRVAVREAASHSKTPWLIAKQNNRPALLVTAEGLNSHFDPLSPTCIANVDNTFCEIWLFDAVVATSWQHRAKGNGTSRVRL
jgi:hypothetical protein